MLFSLSTNYLTVNSFVYKSIGNYSFSCTNILVCEFYNWVPNHHAIMGIRLAIKSRFKAPYHHKAMIEDIQFKWWTKFEVNFINN